MVRSRLSLPLPGRYISSSAFRDAEIVTTRSLGSPLRGYEGDLSILHRRLHHPEGYVVCLGLHNKVGRSEVWGEVNSADVSHGRRPGLCMSLNQYFEFPGGVFGRPVLNGMKVFNRDFYRNTRELNFNIFTAVVVLKGRAYGILPITSAIFVLRGKDSVGFLTAVSIEPCRIALRAGFNENVPSLSKK